MKFWLASTDIKRIEQVNEYGLFTAIVTNPDVVAEANREPVALFRDLRRVSPGPIYYQVREGSFESMQAEAQRMLDIDPTMIGIKVGLTLTGMKVLHWLRQQNATELMATCIPITSHILIASTLGVSWIAPWGSMQEKKGGPSRGLVVAEMQKALELQGSATRLMTGIYTQADLVQISLLGITSCFVWDRDVEKILASPLVEEAVASFDRSWSQIDGASHPAAGESSTGY
jgi:fructose-6-phosphate aldolase 1